MSENDKHPEKDSESGGFSVLDVVRVIGGILFFNALLSYYFTSSTTWGYESRWKDVGYLKFKFMNGATHLTFTEDELALYNGTDPSLPIYIGIYGKVYDVSNSRSTYGPGGSYAFFSGKDGARAFVTGCFNKEDEFTHDLRGLDIEEAMSDISGWQRFYGNHLRYWYVGEVIHTKIIGEPPEYCEGMKFPGT
ncbi:hypothetical protein CLIB1423_02S12134 [[Candida] railenensis]|uniref:Cytochrome b5 heme-binding domain-containing protein n=1 Tax=[Candida] railenensis TaxID=45579 RepID=A0A9P0QMG8_9ASCO|nr:hypothetical protein CLIB1423_02S12134 [[Candida] railenensis]